MDEYDYGDSKINYENHFLEQVINNFFFHDSNNYLQNS